METKSNYDTAILGGGCFWCIEAVFEQVKGVHKVLSGYSGGQSFNPSYEEVCTGKTGHAEVVQVIYNSDELSFKELLIIFFTAHDPTTKDRQGADIGTQYRSIILYQTVNQKTIAENLIDQLNKSKIFSQQIVTEVKPFQIFYKAEDKHQNYFSSNPSSGYCNYVINPKLIKIRKSLSQYFK